MCLCVLALCLNKRIDPTPVGTETAAQPRNKSSASNIGANDRFCSLATENGSIARWTLGHTSFDACQTPPVGPSRRDAGKIVARSEPLQPTVLFNVRSMSSRRKPITSTMISLCLPDSRWIRTSRNLHHNDSPPKSLRSECKNRVPRTGGIRQMTEIVTHLKEKCHEFQRLMHG